MFRALVVLLLILTLWTSSVAVVMLVRGSTSRLDVNRDGAVNALDITALEIAIAKGE